VKIVPTMLWLQATCCGGESTSLLNADQPDVLSGLRLLGVRLLGHSCFDDLEGRPLLEVLEDAATGALPVDLLVVEGAVSRTPLVQSEDRSLAEWLQMIAPRARYAVAVGTCASFGGVMVHGRNKTGATGLQFRGSRLGGLLGEEFRSAGGFPVVNVPGCPAHPDWMFGTFFTLLRGRMRPSDLDRFNRMRGFYSHLAHHGCPRNEYYEFKSSADAYSQQGCLFENLGCKGTQAGAHRELPAGRVPLPVLHLPVLPGRLRSVLRDEQDRRHPDEPPARRAQGVVRRHQRPVQAGLPGEAPPQRRVPRARRPLAGWMRG
jgi:Ni,Fe-hydrogenase I small subunit